MTEPTFHSLANGLQVALWPQDHLHSFVFGLYIRVGSRFEDAQQKGISHFLEHILFRGNAKYANSLEMNRTFESWGGSLNAYTTREYMHFYGQLHPNFLEECLMFVGDMVRKPRFADVDLERNIILEERLEDVDSDGQLLEEDDVSRSMFWGEHPLAYPIIGTPKTIRDIEQTDLEKHFHKHFGAKNMVLCLNGKFDPTVAWPLIETYLGDLPSGQRCHAPPMPEPPTPQQPVAFVHHDSSQVGILVSFRGPAPQHPSYLPMSLIDRVLDDGMSSRLWQRLVEKRGLCYDLWTSIDTYHDFSIFDIGANVAPEKVVELVEGIYKEIYLIREEGVYQDEFEHTRKRWMFRQDYILDHATALNEHVGAQLLYDSYISLAEQRRFVEQLDLPTLNAVSRQIFQSDRQVLTAVGPLRKSIKRRLREITDML